MKYKSYKILIVHDHILFCLREYHRYVRTVPESCREICATQYQDCIFNADETVDVNSCST